jgi:aldehyde:ferredoxin oxidoreductase
MFGYMGKILRINLTKETIKEEIFDEKIARFFIGGVGLCTKILFEEVKPGIDPLGPENKLIFASGPLNGLFPCKYVVAAKSPLTGIFGMALASGPFASEMKYAGYDAIVLEGKAEEPKYLWISDNEIELKRATHIWGKTTNETEKIIKEEVGDPTAKVASIGPAGEKLVKIACIINDLVRAAGRTGLGAVMGSKNLKAIAIKGKKKIQIAREIEFKRLWEKYITIFKEKPHWASVYGTTSGIELYSRERGCLPTKNFTSGVFEGVHNITGETFLYKWTISRSSCPKCPVRCWGTIEIREGKYIDYYKGPRPEYESIAALGSCCLNDDIESIVLANDACNKYGIDTISTGVIIAFIMECYEKGLITKKDTDNLELSWGNSKVILQIIEKISQKDGIGALLSEGVKKIAEKIGGKSKDFAVHVKGLELPMHEPRGQKGMGLAYATSPRGACHNRGRGEIKEAIPEFGINKEFVEKINPFNIWGKAKILKISQDWRAVEDSLVICYFANLNISLIVDLFNAATGFDMSINELMKCGERIFNLQRVFNVREGITRKEDRLPKRIEEPLRGGYTDGASISKYEINSMLNEYYNERGWDKYTGIPTENKLRELDLNEAIIELKNLRKLI